MTAPNKEAAEESWALEAKPPPPYDGSHRYLKSEVAHLLAENQRLREACKKALTCASLNSDVRALIRAALNPPVSLKEK